MIEATPSFPWTVRVRSVSGYNNNNNNASTMRLHYTYSVQMPHDGTSDPQAPFDPIVDGVKNLDPQRAVMLAQLVIASVNALSKEYDQQFPVGVIGAPTPRERLIILQHLNLLGLVLVGRNAGIAREVGPDHVDMADAATAVSHLVTLLDEAAGVIANVDGGSMDACQSEEWVIAANNVLRNHAQLKAGMEAGANLVHAVNKGAAS